MTNPTATKEEKYLAFYGFLSQLSTEDRLDHLYKNTFNKMYNVITENTKPNEPQTLNDVFTTMEPYIKNDTFYYVGKIKQLIESDLWQYMLTEKADFDASGWEPY